MNGKAIEGQILAGEIAGALNALARAEAAASVTETSDTLSDLVLFYTRLGRFGRAFACAEKLRRARPNDLSAQYAWANAAITVGRLDGAEAVLDRIASEAPGQTEIYYTRSVLRRQTPDRNHIEALQALQAAYPADAHQVPLSYALGKEYEDLEQYDQAFEAFSRGATARRRRLSYDVRGDVETLETIGSTFDRRWWESAPEGEAGPGPLFVLGLPRSGTTLVDRILGSHPDVASLGEIDDFTYAIMRAGAGLGDKRALMQKLASTDLGGVGSTYWAACRGYGETAPFLINKTPGNYLYLGLIAKALPDARFIHLRRHPVAGCYAMFKTLFRMGYPFSYAQDDLAAYWLAYDRLMSNWRELLGGRLLDVQYEELVDTQEATSRRIVAHCGLEWTNACLSFHENRAPTATASAAQVRSPIYTTARDLWKHYVQQLGPLIDRLSAAGIAL